MKDWVFALLIVILCVMGAINICLAFKLADQSAQYAEAQERASKCELGQEMMVVILKALKEEKDIKKLEKEMAKDCYPNCPNGPPGWR